VTDNEARKLIAAIVRAAGGTVVVPDPYLVNPEGIYSGPQRDEESWWTADVA
jgi:hypothetical protein